MTTQSAEPLDLDWLAIAGDGVDGITDGQRREVADALGFLATLLGEGVLRDALSWKHPRLGMLIGNKAPWTRPAIVEFARRLDAVRHAGNLSSLLDRLRDPTPGPFREARSVLHVASELASAGCSLAFEPEVVVVRSKAKLKKPDLVVRHASMSNEAFVEVSELHDTLAEKRIRAAMDKVVMACFHPELSGVAVAGGVLHRLLAPPRAERFASLIQETARKALTLGEMIAVVEPGTIEFAVAPISRKAEVAEWGKPRGCGAGCWTGPSHGPDSIERVCGKIRDKIQQLPTDRPGLIAISGLASSWLDQRAAAEMARAVTEETYYWPNLAAVVVGFGAWSRRGGVVRRDGDTYLLARQHGDGVVSRCTVAVNSHSNVSDAEPFQGLVRSAFVEAAHDPATGVADYS